MRKVSKLKYGLNIVLVGIIFLEFVLMGFFALPFFSEIVSGGTGDNVTVTTTLNVGQVYPEILNVSLNNDTNITLTANTTTLVECAALVRDYNNDTDITYAGAELFDIATSSTGVSDDNNSHYSNFTCNITYNFTSWKGENDDNYTALVNCTFNVLYNANPGLWNCSVEINDTTNRHDNNSDSRGIEELLAIGLPNTLDYGTVNSTEVSSEKVANVSNVGNVATDLFLSGYATAEGDGYAMNCTLGDNTAFNVTYEKYNLSETTAGVLSLSEFEATYTNLTSTPVLSGSFDLNYRQVEAYNEAVNASYWRIYVPRGVAGTCQGNILFGAVKST